MRRMLQSDSAMFAQQAVRYTMLLFASLQHIRYGMKGTLIACKS